MKTTDKSALLDLLIDISWKKHGVAHEERYVVHGLNVYRDIFPSSPLESVKNTHTGEVVRTQVPPGALVDNYDERRVMKIPLSRISHPEGPEHLQPGRFFPQGWITGVPGVFKGNYHPFRLVDRDGTMLMVDLNHPLAGVDLNLTFEILGRSLKQAERGGSVTEWLEIATSGPGMQARYNGHPTAFFYPTAFKREDEQSDDLFYRQDRFVHHVDATAGSTLESMYQLLVSNGQKVLDLMAGWESHIPRAFDLSEVHGIGLNPGELKANPVLTDYNIQDLNREPYLDYPDHFFDLAVCSLSVEYLTDPLTVFKEIARVLKPGACFAVTFSNRWFPQKNIRLWADLHEFERLGLVLEYFMASGGFERLETKSVRGYPRPEGDRYAGQYAHADPVYMVTGRTRNRG
ncbi:MAG: methyltransferase domain-containing protein [Desulfobacteraceae bacterium]|nr:MAG: methyltransferase domain-containing protein [Desulfobacteraceae bacterium]